MRYAYNVDVYKTGNGNLFLLINKDFAVQLVFGDDGEMHVLFPYKPDEITGEHIDLKLKDVDDIGKGLLSIIFWLNYIEQAMRDYPLAFIPVDAINNKDLHERLDSGKWMISFRRVEE